MRKVEELVKAINYRIDQLNIFNDQLTELNKNSDKKDLMHIFFENEARINELTTLLEYLYGPDKSNEA